MKNGNKVILAGAGPGDPELITVKALKALQSADVVLYDALVNQQLLSYCHASCKLVSVGKRRGRHAFSQEEINDLIAFYACHYKTVVRLKGGDPFVFGRGHEEMEYLTRRGVNVEVIPGISSAIAGPAAAGIPLTKRSVNESFWVITGTTSSGTLSKDIELASRTSATLVILMGMSNLEEIMSIVSAHRGSDEPVAIIQEATCQAQRLVRGRSVDICQVAAEQGIGSPAVIVIGAVVNDCRLPEILRREELKISVAA